MSILLGTLLPESNALARVSLRVEADNLHRAELSKLERFDQIAQWTRLTNAAPEERVFYVLEFHATMDDSEKRKLTEIVHQGSSAALSPGPVDCELAKMVAPKFHFRGSSS